MRVSSLVLTGLAALLGHASCFPGMDAAMGKIEQMARDDDGLGSTELLGDLLELPSEKLSFEGRAIKDILEGRENPESDDEYMFVPPLDSWWCRKDTCCVWKYIANDLEAMFRGTAGRCTKWARQAIRMGFHDAACWCKQSASQGGGADGSLVLAGELSRFENRGLEAMGARYQALYDRYRRDLGFAAVTMADLLQVGAAVATASCPGGPRARSFVGRRDARSPNPHDLLPSPRGDAETTIAMFRNKTISPRGLVALLGAHTVSQQVAVDKARAGDPQDSTPGVWDTLYYRQMLGRVETPERVFAFPSDVSLARHPSTRDEFAAFSDPGGQRSWNQDYAREYIRLSLLGVNNINDLTECTKALPSKTKDFGASENSKIYDWLQSDDASDKSKTVSQQLENGTV